MQKTLLQRNIKFHLLGPLVLAVVLAGDSQALAFPQVGEPGEGAGQISKPNGVAVDTETGRLYVADGGNHRVDVFDAETGAFELAFGWNVNEETPEEKLQTCTTETGCQQGSVGSSPGQFKVPGSIVVDNNATSSSHHDIYVYDRENSRVQKFSPAGGFLAQIGSPGKGECQFSTETENNHGVAVGADGTVYVGDWVSTESGGFRVRVEKFEPEAPNACIGAIQLAELPDGGDGNLSAGGGLAVDSNGNIYVSFFASSGPRTRKFDDGGNPLGGVGSCISAVGLAVDSADNLFITCGDTVEEIDSSGNTLRVLGYGTITSPNLNGVAIYHSASGEVFVNDPTSGNEAEGEVLYLSLPPPGPIILPEVGKTVAGPVSNTKATLNAQINPEGKATKYYFEYITEVAYEKNAEEAHDGFEGAKRAPESEGADPSAGSDFEKQSVSLQVGCPNPTKQLVEEGKCLEPETEYRFRAFAENKDGEGNSPVEGEPFMAKKPIELIATWSSDVEGESAMVNAEVNPFGIPATGHFEYLSNAAFQKNIEEGHDGFLGATATAEIDLGSAEEPTIGSIPIEGLELATIYHYRLVASDLFVEEAVSAANTLHTFPVGGGILPDGRVYEKVSPPVKNSGEVGVPTQAGGVAVFSVEPQQASPEGAKITYGSFTAFGEGAGSAPATSQYLSGLEVPSLWSTENIDPRFEEGYARDPYVGFSEDLSHAALIVIQPPLTDDATPGFPNLYIRDNETGDLTTVTTKEHTPDVNSKSNYCLAFGGASVDYSRVIFSALGALNEDDPAGDGFNLYEWSEAEGIKLVSRLPGTGKAATPKGQTDFGKIGELNSTRFCIVGGHRMHNAISADGSRIFWTLEGTFQGAVNPLFARVNGSETLRLDEVNQESGISGSGGRGEYGDATADGSKVFFSDEEPLTANASATKSNPDLYLYNFEAPLHHRLTNLTPNGSEPADVQGVIGASEDGSFVYFVATGVLGGDQNPKGEAAVSGEDNLYVWHEGELRFLGALGKEDSAAWTGNPTARLTPDGEHVAFISSERLTDYDNKMTGGSPCHILSVEKPEPIGSSLCPEVYLYDFEADELSCASCNPSGARPEGPARLSLWSTPYQQPRDLSDDGDRLVFDTLDALLPSDSDEKRDVYEFERPGRGDCGGGSPSFSAESEGCLYLISGSESSGQPEDESYLLDASANGDGVFFSTRRRLLPTDNDEHFDIYNARVGGMLPLPPTPTFECSCLDSTAPPPPPPSIGNLEASPPRPSRECPKGTRKMKRAGKERCVKKKRHRHRGKASSRGRRSR